MYSSISNFQSSMQFWYAIFRLILSSSSYGVSMFSVVANLPPFQIFFRNRKRSQRASSMDTMAEAGMVFQAINKQQIVSRYSLLTVRTWLFSTSWTYTHVLSSYDNFELIWIIVVDATLVKIVPFRNKFNCNTFHAQNIRKKINQLIQRNP